MTCPNQLELGEKKLTDESTKEGPHSVVVWTLKMCWYTNLIGLQHFWGGQCSIQIHLNQVRQIQVFQVMT